MTTRQTVTIQGPAERDQIARWARNVEAGTVVTFRKKSRSTEQNAKLHAMLGEVSSQVEWYGQKLDLDDWKDMFTASLRHARVVPGIDKGTFVPLGMHTSTLTIEEMSNLIELIYAFGAEHGVIFKEPKEHEPGVSPTPEADEIPSPSSADATESPSDSVAPTNADTTDTRGGSVSGDDPTGGENAPSQPPAGSRDHETEILIRFAKDVLPMAGNPDTAGPTLGAVEKRWASEIVKLSPERQEQAKAISRSMRAIYNRSTSLESALEFYSEALGCPVTELGGHAND